jgi:hypothetical protein
MAVYNVLAGDFFALYNDDPITNPIGMPISQTFVPRDSAKNFQIDLLVRQTFNVGGVARNTRALVNVSITDTLILYQKGAKGHFETCTHFFATWHSVRPVYYEAFVHNLTLNQSIDLTVSKGLSATLTLAQSATTNVILNRSGNDTLSMNSNANFWTLNKYVSSIPLPTLSGPNAPTC